MCGVDGYFNEHIERLDTSLVDRHWDSTQILQLSCLVRRRTKTTVAIMDKHIATQGNSGEVIDATCPVSDITHDDG